MCGDGPEREGGTLQPALRRMTFLPVVERELRTRARWHSTYWLRCGAALLASGVAAVMMVGALLMGPGNAGKVMFLAMVWPAWLFCLVEGLRNTADCLSEEKREGTLGLLFLTDLRGYDVVLGKFMASSLGTFFSFLAIVPVLGISLLGGGVTVGEFGRVTLALMNTLFFSLTSGLLVSALSRQERQAWLGAMALVAGGVVLLPILAEIAGRGAIGRALALGSPWTSFHLAFESAYARAPRDFWQALLVVHLLGWIWLALASVALPYAWQEKIRGQGRRARKISPEKAAPLATRAKARRDRLLEHDPILWLAAGDDRRGRLVWVPVIMVSLAVALVWWTFPQTPGALVLAWGCCFVLHLLFVMHVAWEACHLFGGLRRSGLFELILATPLSVPEIIRGHDRALRRLFQSPLVTLMAVEMLLAIAHAARVLLEGQADEPAIGAMISIGLVATGLTIFVLDVLAVVRMGMWLSLRGGKPAQAWGWTLLWVEGLPWLVCLLSVFVCCGAATPMVLIAKSIVILTGANTQLQRDLRPAVAGELGEARKWRQWK